MKFLLVLACILLLTKVAESFAIKVGVPYVLGSLLIGIIVGPALLGWIQDSTEIHIFAEIGVILLMFLAGLEADLKTLQKYLKPSILVGSLGVFIPTILFTIVSHFFKFSLQSSIFIGLIFGATSLSITIQVLKELKFLKTKEGSLVVGAVVLDDIIVIILLNLMLSFFSTSTSNIAMLGVILTNVLFLLFIFLFSKFIMPILLKLVNYLKAPKIQIALALALCFSFSYLASFIGISDIVGAFFSGLILSLTKIGPKIEKNIETLTFSLFAPVFFISIGLKVSFEGITSNLLLIFVFTLLAIVSKYIAGYIGAKLSGFSSSSSAIVGTSMISRGEMALILINLGLDNKLITPSIYGALVLVIIITTIIAPILLKTSIQKSKNITTPDAPL